MSVCSLFQKRTVVAINDDHDDDHDDDDDDDDDAVTLAFRQVLEESFSSSINAFSSNPLEDLIVLKYFRRIGRFPKDIKILVGFRKHQKIYSFVNIMLSLQITAIPIFLWSNAPCHLV